MREYLGGLKSKLGGMKEMQAVGREIEQAEGMWERSGRSLEIKSQDYSVEDINQSLGTSGFSKKLYNTTSIEDALELIRNEPIEKYDVRSTNNLLRDIDNTHFSLVEKGAIKREILIKNGFSNFDIKGTLGDIYCFKDMNVEIVELDRPLRLYRRGYPSELKNGLGRWWGDKFRTIEQTRDELAVCEAWENPLSSEYSTTIPKGTKLLKGIAKDQVKLNAHGFIIEYRKGGGTQYFVNDILNIWIN